jgi:aspartyl-tRNA(Asn)/glutamyl-tRNA(Gln) amidotransferase subunit A
MGGAPVDAEVLAATTVAAARFAELGAEVEETEVWAENPEELFRVFFHAESAGYVAAHLDEARAAGVSPGLLERAGRALVLTAAEYAAAQAARRSFDATVAAVFERYDLLLTPTVTVPAFSADLTAPEELAPVIDGVPVSDLGRTPFLYPFNLTGSPACSVPAGFVSDNRPVGLQIVGPRLDDARVLRAALAYERAFPWTETPPH